MCGRFVAATDPDGLARFFVVDERHDGDVAASYNVAPTDTVRAIAEHGGRRHLVALRWGLVPHWSDGSRSGPPLINARRETAAERPAFRDALRRRRCLVPADGFYEWLRHDDGGRTPYFVHPTDRPAFAFAGLWDVWRDPQSPDAPPLRSCTILTTAAEASLEQLHGRMPVVLPAASWDAWLDRDTTDAEAVRGVLDAATPGSIAWHEVSALVNAPRNDTPELVEPVA